jgi:hypothetical protein
MITPETPIKPEPNKMSLADLAKALGIAIPEGATFEVWGVISHAIRML